MLIGVFVGVGVCVWLGVGVLMASTNGASGGRGCDGGCRGRSGGSAVSLPAVPGDIQQRHKFAGGFVVAGFRWVAVTGGISQRVAALRGRMLDRAVAVAVMIARHPAQSFVLALPPLVVSTL